ncbi:hypothetical protein F01_420572 [Burkholderia cenocepacia]|nr:hypothetical protein F01_420572 [Burkholderia cenocepacia]
MSGPVVAERAETGPDRRAFVFVMGSMACRGPGGKPSDHSTQECHTGDSVRGFVRGRDFAMQRLAGGAEAPSGPRVRAQRLACRLERRRRRGPCKSRI